MDRTRLRNFGALWPYGSGGAALACGNPRAAVAGECIPGGIRAAFECDDRAGAPMGTRRKTAERGFVEIADASGAEGVAGGGLRGEYAGWARLRVERPSQFR